MGGLDREQAVVLGFFVGSCCTHHRGSSHHSWDMSRARGGVRGCDEKGGVKRGVCGERLC